MACRKTTSEHAAEVKRIGRVELIGEYVGARTKTMYRCVVHGLLSEALPTNILKGRGLACCKQQGIQDAANRKKAKAAAQYDRQLEIIGRLKRLEPYVDSKTPILHRCLLHGETAPKSPSDALAGKGLSTCCHQAAYERTADKRRLLPHEFLEKLTMRNPNIEWLAGDYTTNTSLITCRCRKHDFVQERVWAMQVLAGHGLKCCGLANSREVGRRSLNGATIDNVWRALANKLDRNGSAYLYLFESPVRGYAKFGISAEPDRRAKLAGYGKQLIAHRFYADRRDAVLVEQAYRYGYGCDSPFELQDWMGNTELTLQLPEEFIEIVEELEATLVSIGRWAFARSYCDPAQVNRAEREQEAVK